MESPTPAPAAPTPTRGPATRSTNPSGIVPSPAPTAPPDASCPDPDEARIVLARRLARLGTHPATVGVLVDPSAPPVLRDRAVYVAERELRRQGRGAPRTGAAGTRRRRVGGEAAVTIAPLWPPHPS